MVGVEADQQPAALAHGLEVLGGHLHAAEHPHHLGLPALHLIDHGAAQRPPQALPRQARHQVHGRIFSGQGERPIHDRHDRHGVSHLPKGSSIRLFECPWTCRADDQRRMT